MKTLQSAFESPSDFTVGFALPERMIGPDQRPVNASIEYFGVLPEGAFPPETDFTKVMQSEVRRRCVSLLDDVEQPFRISSTSLRSLEAELRDLGVGAEIREQIIDTISEGNMAPKYRFVTSGPNKFAVVVSFDDGDEYSHKFVPQFKGFSKNGPGWLSQ